jgi:hypothetical protein
MNYKPPVAKNVIVKTLVNDQYIPVSGPIDSYEKLYASWEYEDANDDPEGEHIYRWYRSPIGEPDGIYTVINKTNGEPRDTMEYIPVDYDVGRYIVFEVTPVQLLLLDRIISSDDELEVTVGTLIDIVT